MDIGFLLHLGLPAQEHAGTKRPFSFVGRTPLVLVCRTRNGVATNPLFLVLRICSTHWLVDLRSQYTLGDHLSSCFCTALCILLCMYYLCQPQKKPGKDSDSQVSQITTSSGAPPPVQHLADGCCQTQTPALHFKVEAWQLLWLLLLVACHFVFPTAATPRTQNVMDDNVQKLNTKK